MNNFKKIKVNFREFNQMRYPTAGDYFYQGNTLVFEIVKQVDWRYDILILIHELAEWAMITYLEIPIEKIDEFDMQWEKDRLPSDSSEPGDCKEAPYYWQHQWATIIEKTLCTALNCNWQEYDTAVLQSLE